MLVRVGDETWVVVAACLLGCEQCNAELGFKGNEWQWPPEEELKANEE